MLEQLFGSRTRIKLLKTFFGEPQKSFFIRELVRKSGERLNSVRRELLNLERLGVVKHLVSRDEEVSQGKKGSRKKRGKRDQDKRKFYVIDHTFALFMELKNLILKSQLAIKKDLSDEIQKAGNIKLLILTGFFVGESQGPDLLVVGSMNRERVKRLVSRFERMIGQEIRYTMLSVNDFNLRQSITDKFLYTVLSGKKIVVVNKFRDLVV